MDITIRPAIPEDYDDLCRLIGQVDTLHHRHLPHIFHRQDGAAREQTCILGLIPDRDNVHEFNREAIAFYLALGYELPSHRMSRPLTPGGDQEAKDD